MTQCLPLLFNNNFTLLTYLQFAGALIITYISLSLPPLSPLVTHPSIGVHISIAYINVAHVNRQIIMSITMKMPYLTSLA